ncbi:glycoside hydrolase family 9 protein [Hellea balneolensis]|uniref:glycoside hydrolase family 9 protein n=1 Tax=Hellea balneolensis TaxID=287478 RepID=UPI00138AFD4A|nr:glycoside hydrolase family 9 protein [Hellea balneolensis]
MFRILVFSFALCLLACSSQTETASDRAPQIVIDQFGYLPELEKRAVIRSPETGYDAGESFTPSSRYAVINTATDEAVFEGAPDIWNEGRVHEQSGDKIWWFDFSAVSEEGTYLIRDMERRVDSHPFDIALDVYTPVLKAAFKTLYYQRAGFEKRAPYALPGYADGASHLGSGQDPQARLFSAKEDASTERDLRGGWYDAGDYNKYTSWTANYIRTLLHSYIENPSVWTDDFGIPESGNGVPDILDEVKWGLDWLERMQNEDGSTLSVMSLSEASPPSAADGPSYYGPANTSASYSSAGAFAMAADVYAKTPTYREDAMRYKSRAARAWNWAEANPNVVFKNNDAEYGSEGLAAGQQEVEGERLQKKILISAIYMFKITGERKYARQVEAIYKQINPITPWAGDGFEGDIAPTLLYFSRMRGVPSAFKTRIRRDYQNALTGENGVLISVKEKSHAYAAPMGGYYWGSNAAAARRGSVFTQAAQAQMRGASEAEFKNAGLGYLNYLHGVNPQGLVYLSNMERYGAESSVSEFYHNWFVNGSADYDSTKTSTYGPAPGFLVGGPNPGYERAECCKTTCGGYGAKMCKRPVLSPPTGQPPMKSYAEFNDGWPINSWSVTENSNSYQTAYIRLLSKYAR